MPENTLPKLSSTRKTGSEHFRSGDSDAGFNLLEFWQWSMSGLEDNTIRGILAEFIVARAVGASTVGARDPWATFDLAIHKKADKEIKIEVKSSSYVQSWAQSRLSDISFGIAPSYAWNPEIGDYEGKLKRHADVYVFALLAHKDQPTIDPMDLDQWEFYVLPTAKLNANFGNQKRITLSKLK